MITPGLADLAKQYDVSPDLTASLTVGSFTFWSAAASFFGVSAASIWGRRPLYVITAVIVVATNAVAYLFKVRRLPWLAELARLIGRFQT